MPSELGALRNQLRTFARFFDTSSVAEYILASPAADVTNTIAYVQNVISESANLSTVQFRLVCPPCVLHVKTRSGHVPV